MTEGNPATNLFAPPCAECPNCKALCKRHSIRERRVKDLNLECSTALNIKVGVYRCQVCKKFFCFQPPFARKGCHYTRRTMEKACTAVAEDKTPFSSLQRRLKRDFHVQPGIATGYRWFHEVAGAIELARDYEPWAVRGFSGVLVVDELYDHYAVLVATDPLNDKTLSVKLCPSANEDELRQFLLHLRDLGINPSVIITDGSPIYHNVPKEVWPGVSHQLCIFHFTRAITKNIMTAINDLRGVLARRVGTKEDAQRIWSLRYTLLSREEKLGAAQRATIAELSARYARLRLIRDLVRKVYNLFTRDQTVEEAWAKRQEIIGNELYEFSDPLKRVVRTLRTEQFTKTITFLDYVNCPRTSNHVERANRYYRKRAKSHYRNRTKRAIWNMVKTDLLVRKANYIGGPPQKLQPRIEETEIFAA